MADSGFGARLSRLFGQLFHPQAKARKPGATPRPPTSGPTTGPTTAPAGAAYPGDFDGRPAIDYRPVADAFADPGEVVWTWIPFEENHAQGKDRPALVIGRDGGWLLALPMTSKDHDRDHAQEARQGRFWCDIGTGPWDRQGRPSEVRVDRIVRVDRTAVRRIGAVLDRERFDQVARQVLAHCGGAGTG